MPSRERSKLFSSHCFIHIILSNRLKLSCIQMFHYKSCSFQQGFTIDSMLMREREVDELNVCLLPCEGCLIFIFVILELYTVYFKRNY